MYRAIVTFKKLGNKFCTTLRTVNYSVCQSGFTDAGKSLVSLHPCWRADGQLYKSSMVFSNPVVIQRSFHQTSPEKYIPKITSSYENTALEKGNIMLLGPTGAGKRTMAQLTAKKLDLPLSISWAGDHIKNIIGKLLRQVNYDVERAQTAVEPLVKFHSLKLILLGC
ncbi:ATP-dependent Clp protease ATP-binding subunit ClpX-like [Rhopalosiphum padi]|uniref:ATP-dependent Clp protease ATP-binding subunit ClpX-like n=1 Tax=Rhopalosiphum padi TaxID=40932 RepID=UPI00298DBA51|nr:ATP-dependent Clp protease ATP-binding subunit ClpX-like [Rhopalosiphum padi]